MSKFEYRFAPKCLKTLKINYLTPSLPLQSIRGMILSYKVHPFKGQNRLILQPIRKHLFSSVDFPIAGRVGRGPKYFIFWGFKQFGANLYSNLDKIMGPTFPY